MIDLLRLALVGIISGVFSSLIAYRSHRQKKWWEIRVDAYAKLLEALSDVTHYYSRHFDAHICQRDLNEEYEKKLRDAWDQGFPRVRRAADTGAFIYSLAVNKVLSEFLAVNEEDHGDYSMYLDQNMSAARKCLCTVVECSKRDLEMRWWWV